MDTTCSFCEIVASKRPSSLVHEDGVSLAFMGIRPLYPGELLIIPKEHTDHFCDIPDQVAAQILVVAQALSRTIRQVLSPQRVGLVVSGFGVPHAHLSVVPLRSPDDIVSARYAYFEGGQLAFSEQQIPRASRVELDEMACLLSGQPMAWVQKGPR